MAEMDEVSALRRCGITRLDDEEEVKALLGRELRDDEDEVKAIASG
jgi:hypothetical protein